MKQDVLLLEDEADDRRLVAEALSQTESSEISYEVREAETLASALEELDKKLPDVALVDLRLPDSDGLATLEAILAKAPTLPIVVLTGGGHDMDLSALEAGAQDYMLKDAMTPRHLHTSLQYAIVRAKLLESQLNRDARAAADREFLEGGQERGAPVTAAMVGVRDLRQADPHAFKEFVRKFCELLELSFEEQRLKVRHGISNQLRELAQSMGALRASHVDVVDLLRQAVEEMPVEDENRKDWLMFEARHRGFQIMGFLVAYYRAQSIGRKK